jgi:hypothetical protein
MTRARINESLRKHLGAERPRYCPETHEPLNPEQRRADHDLFADGIREGRVEVVENATTGSSSTR